MLPFSEFDVPVFDVTVFPRRKLLFSNGNQGIRSFIRQFQHRIQFRMLPKVGPPIYTSTSGCSSYFGVLDVLQFLPSPNMKKSSPKKLEVEKNIRRFKKQELEMSLGFLIYNFIYFILHRTKDFNISEHSHFFLPFNCIQTHSYTFEFR